MLALVLGWQIGLHADPVKAAAPAMPALKLDATNVDSPYPTIDQIGQVCVCDVVIVSLDTGATVPSHSCTIRVISHPVSSRVPLGSTLHASIPLSKFIDRLHPGRYSVILRIYVGHDASPDGAREIDSDPTMFVIAAGLRR